ncbi:outer membrane lipoprotein-sorting protein [Candidatus Poribacteria bacterium]|nr:outer membrane lipoprotein-sorting protein [Candidatus Poribacteria bacterium]MBT7098529.1 outer membrane lipoprotein-sorting protein [Candidatus Poribacteria bacterium]MBT7807886.1 outer membrane lipoprotein-sorting protein [Candidatus Poribacteria bacterium]
MERLTKFSLDRPKTVLGLAVLITVLFATQLPKVKTDTDPENMLDASQEDRVYYDELKEEFGIRDMLVVGIVDEQGIFRSQALTPISQAIAEIVKVRGVVIEDVVSLTTTNNVKSGGGLLEIRPPLAGVPTTEAGLAQVRADIADNPFLHEKIASADGAAVAIYVPIQAKDMSYRVSNEIQAILDRELLPHQEYHLAGLPVAEDTFGHEMFVQMAVVAPITFVVVLILAFLLFRTGIFLLPLALTAMFSVVWTMGLLIGAGNTLHIMSSMIPVFLMPIAILDAVHILSEFFDKYRERGESRVAVMEAMKPLYRPMFMTSLTSGIGFASLALADIPPVRVFGLFVAFGIAAAWLLSITLVPAAISLTSEERLRKAILSKKTDEGSAFDRVLRPLGRFTYARAHIVILVAIGAIALGVMGLMRIEVNDNPVRWFRPRHPLRVADRVMNEAFGGTYMADIVLESGRPERMRNPEVLTYLAGAQEHLESHATVGKTSSVADIVKRIHLVLFDNDPAYDTIPDSSAAVGNFLFLFESSGGPGDLARFLNADGSKAHVWVQMKAGDNSLMQEVVAHMDAYVAANPLPEGVSLHWSGMTYINMVWQGLMVSGMLKAVLGSFAVVFILMLIEFRSLFLALLSMIPLTLAILLSYGLIGWAGKEYDMPIAVCSSLALGLAIDFAIHFLHRFRDRFDESGDLADACDHMFGEPARAISRNAVIVSLGFLPLVLSTLTPYVTVGLFFAMLMAFSTAATLALLPSLLKAVGAVIYRSRTMKPTAATIGLLMLGAFLTAAPFDAHAADLSADEIMTKSHDAFYYAANDMKTKVTMSLIDDGGSTRERVLTLLRIDDPESANQKYFVYFHRPGDVRDMTFMVWKHADAADDRWLFIPAVDLIRRISADDKRSSFVGSDFTYEDVSGRAPSEDTHTVVRDEAVDGRDAHVVESVPKGGVDFTRKLTWVDAETFLPLKEEYYDAQQELARVFTADKIETIDGVPTIVERTMANVKAGHRTEVVYADVEYDGGLEDGDFSERNMRKPPRGWTR